MIEKWRKINVFLINELDKLNFSSPVHTVYNPLTYAGKTYEEYLLKYGNSPKKVIFLGMNPGPWGMVQTGIPFGEVNFIKDFLQIKTKPSTPKVQHPKRLIQGFDCTKSEVSGKRLWGWISQRFKTPEDFFEDFFVANYCPLAFMEESGRNRTPDKLSASERKKLYKICDDALIQTVKLLEPKWIIGIGKFAEKRAKTTLSEFDIKVGYILHPSPASPLANKNWSGKIEVQLQDYNIL